MNGAHADAAATYAATRHATGDQRSTRASMPAFMAANFSRPPFLQRRAISTSRGAWSEPHPGNAALAGREGCLRCAGEGGPEALSMRSGTPRILAAPLAYPLPLADSPQLGFSAKA